MNVSIRLINLFLFMATLSPITAIPSKHNSHSQAAFAFRNDVSFFSHHDMSIRSAIHQLTVRSSSLHLSSNNNNDDDVATTTASTIKRPPLLMFLDSLSNTFVNTKQKMNTVEIKERSLVIAKCDYAELGIYQDQTYQVHSIFFKGKKPQSLSEEYSSNNNIVDTIPLSFLDLNDLASDVPSGYTLYVGLYNSVYHDNERHGGRAVIVEPNEVGLISMQEEIIDSILVALPIFSFWVWTCILFTRIYQEKYGGDVLDAFLGR